MNEQVTPEGDLLPEVIAPEQQLPDGEADAEGEVDPPKPTKDGKDVRIDELTRKWREADRRNERLMRALEERAIAPPAPAPQPPAPVAPKTLKDFNYDEAAYTAHVINEAVQNATKGVEAKLNQSQAQQSAEQIRTTYYKRAAEFAKTTEDYYDVAGSSPASQVLIDSVMELEHAPLVAYHLGNNHELAEELSALSEREANRRLGKLEDRLVAEQAKLKAKRVSDAPPPPPKIDGNGSAPASVSTTSPESDKLSDEEWVKAETKRLARKRAK
jgi:hypothetical protein